MGMKKQVVLFSLILGVIVSLCVFNLPSFSKEKPSWDNVAFATHGNLLKFFDRKEGKIYIYEEGKGNIKAIWQLNELGKKLKKEKLKKVSR